MTGDSLVGTVVLILGKVDVMVGGDDNNDFSMHFSTKASSLHISVSQQQRCVVELPSVTLESHGNSIGEFNIQPVSSEVDVPDVILTIHLF